MPNRRRMRLIMRALAAAILLAVANLSPTFYAKPTAAEAGEPFSQGLIFRPTSEVVAALQQTAAFPEADAGFSSYYRIRDDNDNFTLDKSAVDGVLLSDPPPLSVRTSPASLVSVGDNYSVASFPVLNIDQTTTSVQVYYDSGGWVVAYFPRGGESSRAWQAVDLDAENPTLESLDRTTLLDAINAVVNEALSQPKVATADLGFYHWEFPTANAFFMMANARGTDGSDSLSFAVPAGFTVHEASISLWVSGTEGACADVSLDGTEIIASSCDRQFQHARAPLTDFNAPSGHTMISTHTSGGDYGGSGVLIMLVYTVPQPGG